MVKDRDIMHVGDTWKRVFSKKALSPNQ